MSEYKKLSQTRKTNQLPAMIPGIVIDEESNEQFNINW